MRWLFELEMDPLKTITQTEMASYLEAVLREQWGLNFKVRSSS